MLKLCIRFIGSSLLFLILFLKILFILVTLNKYIPCSKLHILITGFPILFLTIIVYSIRFIKVAFPNYILCSKCIYSYFGLSHIVL